MHDHSMKSVLLVLGLLVVAWVGSSKALGNSRFRAVRLLAKTSILFLVLGAIIGPQGFDLISPDVLEQLGPIVVIGLGWIGFLYGTHLEYRSLRRFRPHLFATAFAQSLLTMLVVMFGLFSLASLFPALNDWKAILILTSAAAGTAPAALYLLRSELTIKGPNYELLRFCASLDDLPGLLGLGLLFCVRPPDIFGNAPASAVFWFVAQVLLGLGSGALIHALFEVVSTPEGTDPGVFALPFFGMVGLTSGFASYMGMSPLFVNVIAGISFANVSVHSERVYAGLARREHTVYVLFLLVSGCYWPFRGFNAFALLAIFIALRATGKVLGAWVATRAFLGSNKNPPVTLGLGMLPQGGLAIAMVVNYLWSFGDSVAAWAINLVHISVILQEFVAPYLLFRFLRSVDEA